LYARRPRTIAVGAKKKQRRMNTMSAFCSTWAPTVT
jgi:hypothetical protein